MVQLCRHYMHHKRACCERERRREANALNSVTSLHLRSAASISVQNLGTSMDCVLGEHMRAFVHPAPSGSESSRQNEGKGQAS